MLPPAALPVAQAALVCAQALDTAEAEQVKQDAEFGKAIAQLEKMAGMEFRTWGNRPGYCWWKHGIGYSINYASRAGALRALVDDRIEWIRKRR